jgi:hypothetical protein
MRTREEWLIAHLAHTKVYKAVRDGALQRPDTCDLCGGSKPRIEAHHRDYSKPLEVDWVCTPCHNALDEQMRLAGGLISKSLPAPVVPSRPKMNDPKAEGTPVRRHVSVKSNLKSLRIPVELSERLKALSAETGFSISALIVACLKVGLPTVEAKARQQSQSA